MSATMTSPPFELSLRTQVRAELATMNCILRLPFHDEMTDKISLWHGHFVEEVRVTRDDLPAVIARNLSILRKILVDPITCSPLEKVSYLAGDMAIGRRAFTYCLHNGIVTDDLFPATRHTVVECAVLLLQRYNAAAKPLPQISREYKKLKGSGALPEIMTDPKKVNRMREMREIVREQEALERAEVEAKEEARRITIVDAVAYIGRSLLNIEEIIAATEEREAVRTEAARGRDVKNEVQLREDKTNSARRNAEFRDRIEVLTARIDAIWGDIPEVERDITRVQRAIEATEKAIEDKKRRDQSNAWDSIIKVALFATASWGAHIAIAQPAGGGFTMGTSIPI